MSSAILDVRAVGPQNGPLNDKPTTSFFIATYARHFPFARESVEVPVIGQPGWGSACWVNLGKRGDLTGRFYWAFHVPGIRHKSEKMTVRRSSLRAINYRSCDDKRRGHRRHRGRCDESCSSSSSSSSSCSSSSSSSRSCCDSSSSSSSSCRDSSSSSSSCRDSSSSSRGRCGSSSSSSGSSKRKREMPRRWAHYVNCLAHVIVEHCDWLVGGHVVDTHHGEWMEIFERYTLPAGQTTDEIVGRYRSQYALWEASRRPQIRYARMRFSFCEWMSHALPVVTIYWSTIQAKLYTRPLHECFMSCDDTVPHLIDADKALQDTDLKVRCWVNTYWVSKKERKDIDNSTHEYIITQNQRDTHDLPGRGEGSSDAPHPVPLKFQHTVTSILWTVQALEHRRRKDWFNYSGCDGEDPITRFRMRVNGGDRVTVRECRWFRTVEANEMYSRTPDLHAYGWSFCAEPEKTNKPTGSLNWSQIDDVIADLEIQPGLGPAAFTCWARNSQILKVKGHLCGPAYH